jgi:hypothetical protein
MTFFNLNRLLARSGGVRLVGASARGDLVPFLLLRADDSSDDE